MFPRRTFGHTPFQIVPDAMILRRSTRHVSQLPSNVYTAKAPAFSGAEARLVTHNQTSGRKLLNKNLCRWRCKELVRTDPSLLAAPVPSLLSRMLPRHSLWIVARDGHFESPELQNKLEELDLLVEQKYAISNQMLQACYEFTLTARLAPKWNAVKDVLIMGCEFLTTGQAHAVDLDVRLTANEVILGIGVRELSLEFLKLEDLSVDDSSALDTLLTDPNSVASLNCQGTSCVLLPSLKKGYVSSVSREPPSRDFPTYDKLREHWEKQSDIVLPENEDLFYAVGFGRKMTSLYTYPASCVYKSLPTAVPVEDSCETRLAAVFVEDVHAVMPTVCGEGVSFAKGDSTKLSYISSQRLSESDAGESCTTSYSLDFPFDGENNTAVPDREENLLATEGKIDPAKQSAVETAHAPEATGASLKMNKVERAEGRFYHVSVRGTLCDLPSVTTVLKRTMPRQSFFRLLSWRKSMTKEHGSQGYRKIAAETLRRGSAFHQQLEDYLQKNLITTNKEDTMSTIKQPEGPLRKSLITTGKDDIAPAMSIKQPEDSLQKSPITISDAEEDDIMPTEGIKQQLRQGLDGMGYMQSVQHVLEDISEVHALESGLTHPELGYAGTVDCIAKYKDKLCVIDWKTSSTPRPAISDLFDFPLQVAAYAGAINQDTYFRFKVHNVLIVVAYESGAPAHPHLLSHQQCLQYWQQWLARLNHYHSTESSGSAVNLT